MLHRTSEGEGGGHGSYYQLHQRTAEKRDLHSDPGDLRPSRSGVSGISGGFIVSLAPVVDGKANDVEERMKVIACISVISS